MQMDVASRIISRLYAAMESRSLTNDEFGLRMDLKHRYEGLAVILKIQHRQRSRLTWIRVGDANMRLFHIRVNGWRPKKFVQVFRTDDGFAVAREDKERVISNHFKSHLRHCFPPRHQSKF